MHLQFYICFVNVYRGCEIYGWCFGLIYKQVSVGAFEEENESLRARLQHVREENARMVSQNHALLNQMEAGSHQLRQAQARVSSHTGCCCYIAQPCLLLSHAQSLIIAVSIDVN